MLLPLLLGQGTGGGGSGSSPVVYRDHQWSTGTGHTTHTWTAMAIGPAASSRWVIAALNINHNISRSIASVTIGGVSATRLYSGASPRSTDGVTFEFWAANVPTGTTADVVANSTADQFWDGAAWTYTCTGEPLFEAGQTDQVISTFTYSVAINVAEGGAVIALVNGDGAAELSAWTGVTADFTDEIRELYAASEDQLAAETGRTISWLGTAAPSPNTSFYGLGALSIRFAGGASVSGTSSVTLAGVTQAGTGVVPVSGTSAVTLAGVTQTGAGQVPALGSSSVTLAGVSQAAAGQVAVRGTGTVTLDGVTQAATGTVADPPAGIVGSSSVTLAGVTQAAAGQVAVTGASAVMLGGVSQTGAGQVSARGTSAVTLGGVTQSGAGQIPVRGTSSVTLAGVTQSGAARVAARGTSSVALDGVTQTGAGQVPVRGSSAVSLDGVTLVGAGGGALPAIQGVGFAILQGIVQQASGSVATPVSLPYDWAPPVDLATSGIIGQALRFMRLAPVGRHDPTSELLPALVDAFDSAFDELLSAADWSFASVLASLPRAFPALTAEDDMPTLCMLPGDLVQLREVRPCEARWRIDGATLRTSADAPVIIRYTARITREEALPATFQTAVALRIALLLGARWAGSAVDPEELDYQARQQMKQAMRDDTRHASAARAVDLPDLGYGTPDGDWAMEAVG